MTVRIPRMEKSIHSNCQVASMLVIIALAVGVLDDEEVVDIIGDRAILMINR